MKKSAQYYSKNSAARAKKAAYDSEFNKKPAQVAKRVETNKANRKAGTYGKMSALGKDRSHTKSGGLVLEDRSKNRARNGANGKSTKKC